MLRRFAILAGLVFALSGTVFAQSGGPAGQAWSVESGRGSFTIEFASGGQVRDSRGGAGRWHFDGRTLCVSTQGREICEPWRDLDVGDSYMSRAWSDTRQPVRVTRIA